MCGLISNLAWSDSVSVDQTFRELHALKYYLSILRPSIFQLICLDKSTTLPFSVPCPHFLVPFHVKESFSFSLCAFKDRFNSAKTPCRLQNFYMFSKLMYSCSFHDNEYLTLQATVMAVDCTGQFAVLGS